MSFFKFSIKTFLENIMPLGFKTSYDHILDGSLWIHVSGWLKGAVVGKYCCFAPIWFCARLMELFFMEVLCSLRALQVSWFFPPSIFFVIVVFGELNKVNIACLKLWLDSSFSFFIGADPIVFSSLVSLIELIVFLLFYVMPNYVSFVKWKDSSLTSDWWKKFQIIFHVQY